PLGDRNRPVEFHPVPIDPALAVELAGRYHFGDGFEIAFTVEDGKLIGRFGEEGPPREVFTEDGRWFRASGEPDIMEFRRDAGGRVTGVVSGGFDVGLRRPCLRP